MRAAIYALAVACSVAITACAGGYSGSARATAWPPSGGDWQLARGVPEVRQRNAHDCGPAALSAVLRFWGRDTAAPRSVSDGPVEAGALRDSARRAGLRAFLIRATVDDLRRELARGRPVLVGTVKPFGRERRTHYEVVVGLDTERERVVTLDPAHGWRVNSLEGFDAEWRPSGRLAIVTRR